MLDLEAKTSESLLWEVIMSDQAKAEETVSALTSKHGKIEPEWMDLRMKFVNTVQNIKTLEKIHTEFVEVSEVLEVFHSKF